MTSEKLEYDSTLGGNIVLPEYIKTFHYASAHVNEIKQLLNEVNTPQNTKLVFQSLPKHMRRRAMSHNPKRLPRKYRAAHKSQMLKSGNPQQTKRPSRKYRRKPSNLLKEYLRRQQKNIWLETHIWHAKRFHMISKWGYKLPYASCDKTYRACYRASSKHCLIQDISFFGCIEIKGNVDVIKEGFSHLTSNKCGLSIAAKAYTTGKREGFLDLFKCDQYPRGALTRVSFIWKPSVSVVELTRTVWVFAHPSAYREVLEEIIKIFNVVSTKTTKNLIENEAPMEVDKESDTKKNGKQQVLTKTQAFIRTPVYINEETGISLTELKDTINRFRLTGPLSQSVLCNALKCKPISENEPENWFKDHVTCEKFSKSYEKQKYFWDNCKYITSPNNLISNMILGLNVEDPRINRPQKRDKALPLAGDLDRKILYELPDEISYSVIWDSDLRDKITENMMSTHQICTERNKQGLIPGERCRFENDLQPVPVLLIQRPGSQNNSYKALGYGCGWDIIIPSGYALSFWLSFVMWGAKPGGLRELNSINRESGQEQFLPDTISGIKESYEKHKELRDKYFRLPPNKRCNYKKFSITSPFKVPLAQLVKEWNNDESTFFILRDKQILQEILQSFLKNSPLNANVPQGCLIQIYLKMKTRGNPGDFSIICLPKKEDFKRFLKNKKYFNNNPIYTEPLKQDDKELERKQLRLEHKKLLKRLKARRVKEKKILQETSRTRVRIRPAGTSAIVAEQFKKMSQLWLPEIPSTVRYQCTREVFGYVTQGDFSFTESSVTGIGYVTYEGLKKLHDVCKNRENMILVRGTKTRSYRFANFKINCQI